MNRITTETFIQYKGQNDFIIRWIYRTLYKCLAHLYCRQFKLIAAPSNVFSVAWTEIANGWNKLKYMIFLA